jgi:hypothetical protein
VALQMSTARVESLDDGTLRVSDTCSRCNNSIAWDYVANAADGRFLVGHCACDGERHLFALGPQDKAVDRNGRIL